jgi:hypothetical protein
MILSVVVVLRGTIVVWDLEPRNISDSSSPADAVGATQPRAR